jgi:hypothetical protein
MKKEGLKKRNHWMFYVGLVMVLGLFSGCDKEDDKDIDSSNLIGTWILTHREGYEYGDGAPAEWDEDWYDEDWYDDGYIKFKKNGTFVDRDGDGGNWKLKGNRMTLSFDYDDDDYDDGDEEFTVSKLTSSTMIWEYREKDKDEDYEYYEKLTLKKVTDGVRSAAIENVNKSSEETYSLFNRRKNR